MIVRLEKNGETQMTEFLVTHFIKNHEAVEKVSVRTAYGVLASVVGIFCNVFLFVDEADPGTGAAQCVGHGGCV